MKHKLILGSTHGRPSTKLAFSTMESDSVLVQRRNLPNKTYYRVFKDRKVLSEKIENFEKYLYEMRAKTINLKDSIVVRWGTREVLETNKSSVVYNRIPAIANATNKKHSRELFIENGVNCPALVTPENFNEDYLPIIARPLVHAKAKNFVVLKTEEEFYSHYLENSQGWYYSNFIDKDREFRAHVAHGKILALMEKPKPEIGGHDNMAWNRAHNGDVPFDYVKWDRIDGENLKPVLVEAIKACDALGLDMGGIDVMLKGGTAYVLEANTAPTLNSSPYVAKRYSMYFDWLFRSETRREHWNVLNKDDGKSMIWKNFQLLDERR